MMDGPIPDPAIMAAFAAHGIDYDHHAGPGFTHQFVELIKVVPYASGASDDQTGALALRVFSQYGSVAPGCGPFGPESEVALLLYIYGSGDSNRDGNYAVLDSPRTKAQGFLASEDVPEDNGFWICFWQLWNYFSGYFPYGRRVCNDEG